jgi:cytochrome c-type biogenesis protein CcmH/NrfG
VVNSNEQCVSFGGSRIKSFLRCYETALFAALVFAAARQSALAQEPSNTSRSSISSIVEPLRNQNFDEAIRQSDTFLKRDPHDYRVWTLRGMAFAGENSLSSALEAYQHALQLSPDYLPALEGAAQTEYQQGSPAAKALILRVLNQRPNDATSLAMLGFLEYREHNCKDAVPHFEKSEAALAAQPFGLAAYASCLAQAGEYRRAIPLFHQALTAEPSAPSIRFNLALAEWKAGKPQDALAALRSDIEAAHPDVDTLRMAAAIYESENDTQHAVELLRKAILEDPSGVDAYLDFADLSFDHGSAQVGIDIINAGMTQLPNEAHLYLVRGVLYTQLGIAAA